MKKNNIISDLENMISEKRNTISTIKAEISSIESEIISLQDEIANYTNIDDVKTYSDLKNRLEIRQHKLDMLKRNLRAELSCQNNDQIGRIISEIIAEKRALDSKYGDEMLEIIRKLKEKLEEADKEKNRLQALYESYMQTFNVQRNNYPSYDPLDSSGIAPNVQKMINSLKGLGKL